MMRILAIGGSRFIGLATVRQLVERGHEVVVFNRGQTPVELPDGVRQITGDKADLLAHRGAFEAFAADVVWHNVVVSDADAQAMIDAFRGIAGRLVMVSSMDVYKNYGILLGLEQGAPVPVPYDEDSPLRDVLYPYRPMLKDETDRLWNYDKIPAERLILDNPDTPGTVLRLPMVYGENDFQRRLTPFLKPMIDGRSAIVSGEGYAAWRSTYGYVENVAAAIRTAIEDDRAAGHVYNVGEIAPSMLELGKKVKAILGWQGDFVVVPDAELPESMRDSYVYAASLAGSDARIRRELDYAPIVATDDALRRTIAWERDHLDPEANYAEMYNYAAQDEVLAAKNR